MNEKRETVFFVLLLVTLASIVFGYLPTDVSLAQITGECSNCHTMHNSQDGSPMATYGADGQPWKGTG
ncbi:MAG: hypothetical protein SVW57_04960, partial [Thermodesulfobacteriota bacterium]|nr:hypothetical protein [Thermodesulfobacteriota bacterium]